MTAQSVTDHGPASLASGNQAVHDPLNHALSWWKGRQGGRLYMRRRLILWAVALSVAGVLAVGRSTQARAGGSGAEVVRGDGDCFVAGSTGSWLFSCKIQFVIGPDGAINQHITGS